LIAARHLDDVVMASSHEPDYIDLANIAAQRLNCNTQSPQTFLGFEQAGLQALSHAYQSIALQGQSCVLVGGVESVHAPILSMSDALSEWLQAWKSASGLKAKTKIFNKLHTRYFQQRAKTGLSPESLLFGRIAQAEQVSNEHAISLEAQAEYVNLSQRRLKYAQRNDTLCKLTPIYYPDGSSCSSDENLISLDPESLKQALQTGPAATGLITHSSVAQATEGACCLLLASQSFVDTHQLTPLAQLSAPTWQTQSQATEAALDEHQLSVSDIDYWEWDETSAAEILALKQHPLYQSLNSFDHINLEGGSLSLGCPNAAGQLRNILQLSHTLKRNDGQYGVCHFGFNDNKNSAVLLRNAKGGA
jgi:acetyl-CoA C-acetyltransferase